MRGLTFNYAITQHDAAAELYIDRGTDGAVENKHIFDALATDRTAIETAFGGPLEWERLDNRRACRIRKTLSRGGYRDEEALWPVVHNEMVDAMVRLHRVLEPYVSGLRSSLKALVREDEPIVDGVPATP